MGAVYADEYRVIIYQDGAPARDITALCGDLQARDELDALAVELTFSVLVSPWDKYAPKQAVCVGDKVRVLNHDAEVFAGVVVTAGIDGQVTAYDRGWYLNESEIILQCAGVAAQDAVRQLCGKAGIAAGVVCPLATLITQVWVGSTPADILSDILSACTLETGKQYRHRVIDGKLTVSELTSEPIVAYHKPAKNLAAFPVTWALGQVSGEDSISDMRNAVVIAAEKDGDVRIGAVASNAASISRYGFLQHVETAQQADSAKLAQQAKNLLALSDCVARTRTVDEIWGADEVQSGVVLTFNSPAFGLSGKHRVTGVTHHYSCAHTMSLSLQALDEPRAAGTEDSAQAWDIPTSFFSADSGGGSGNGDAAAFVAAASGEVGYQEEAGNRNKYGAWAGNDGVAWCVYFVCWCANQSGAPIPTGYGWVGDMTQYFTERGKYKTAASGYIPAAGDLMIQGTRHMGIVERADGSAVQTIEGNTSDGVRRMTRYYSEISGFCTPFAS